MSTEVEILFQTKGAHRSIACLDITMGFSELASCYLQAANDLIQMAVDHTEKLDVHVYPAVFLYRHSIELLLKQSIWMSNYLLGQGKSFHKNSHCLTGLWAKLKHNAKELLAAEFPLSKEEIEFVEKALQEYETHDLGSDSFRYPIDKKRARTHPDLTKVDVLGLYETFNRIDELVGRITYMVGRCYELEAEWNHCCTSGGP